MLLYYITDRRQFPGTAADQRRALLAKIAEAARAGVDYIQLREKDLPVRDLEQLAREAVDLGAPGRDPVYGFGMVGETARTAPERVGARRP